MASRVEWHGIDSGAMVEVIWNIVVKARIGTIGCQRRRMLSWDLF